MKIKEFNELDLYTANIISIIGSGITPKMMYANKLLTSMHDKLKESIVDKNNQLIVTSNKFKLTIFSYDYIQNYERDMRYLSVHRSLDNLEDYYLIKKYNYYKNKNLELEIVLIDQNLMPHTIQKNKYLRKLFKNYKKFNLIIIFYTYHVIEFKNFSCNYSLLLRDDFESSQQRIYDMYYKDHVKFNKFKKIYKEITKESDTALSYANAMVVYNNIKGRFYKMNKFYNANAERRKKKQEASDYDAMSDESNIRFF
jgi:hypothetical protein